VGDLERDDLMDRYRTLVRKHERLLGLYDHPFDLREAEAEWLDAVQQLRAMPFVDSEHYLDTALRSGKRVLAEGAQGTLLDIDFGTYPFVTSSSTICAGACTGLGVAPTRIGKVVGIFKAYSTRVGSGPFPTELHDATGEHIRKAGHEFGSTTGRPRRCGWLDLPALHYAVMVNGITELAMMKADVLNGMDTVRLCTHYRINGQLVDRLPYDISTDVEPVYADVPGWGDLRTGSELPDALERYIARIEQAVGVPITLVSMGPDRAETVHRSKALAH
jgi:adenylosuccinate synthase